MSSIFSKPNTLVYVHRSGLIVAGKHITQARLDFTAQLVTNLEVLDHAKLVERCRLFFTDHDLRKKRVLVVLDNSIVFRKNIELDEAGKPDALTEAFIAAMPFAEGQRACLTIQADDLLQLLATNAPLYQAIADALAETGVAKVTSITPAAAYDLSGTNRNVTAMVERFFKDTPAAKQADFTTAKPL